MDCSRRRPPHAPPLPAQAAPHMAQVPAQNIHRCSGEKNTIFTIFRIFTVAQVRKTPETKVGFLQRDNFLGGRQLDTNEERLEDLLVSLKVSENNS